MPQAGKSQTAAIAIAAAVAASNPAAAGENSVVPETVLITARPPDPVGNAAFSTTTLDAREVQLTPQLDLSLRQVPGLSLFRRNSSLSANPSVQGVSLRSIAASGAGRALVTLDGVPQNDPFGGWVIWSSLPPEDIQGVEVVKGAGAGPYGAGALTGVIALFEREGAGLAAEVYGGDHGQGRASAAGGVQFGTTTLGASAMYQTTSGWIPVNEAQRGAADTPVTLKASSESLRAAAEVGPGTVIVGRLGTYDEKRDSGVLNTRSRAQGTTGSLTLAHPEAPGGLGWRAQAWFRDVDLSNTSASIGAGRATATPSNNQYATPALGWGGNAAIRGAFDFADWEVGVDARVADGESQELFTFTSGRFQNRRISGGKSVVEGVYAEGASRFDGWLVTLGARVDNWENSNGHIIQSSAITGAVTSTTLPASSSGTIASARGGVRKDVSDELYVRAAAYNGFRPASLNELYRGFRLGNNFTLANAALKPEKLYGAEIGAGDDKGAFTWNVTGFWNKLSDAITNVTIGKGPGTFPIAGTLPAGGLLIERQNVGYVRAYGLEGEAQYQFDTLFELRGAFALTDAQVNGGAQAAQLTGRRPLQTPRWTVTGGIVATPHELVTLEAYLRYESLRYSDDLNTLPLAGATTVDARVSFHVLPTLDLYAAVDNVFDTEVGSARGADQVVTIDAPRMFRAGISFRY
jgi:outer membrane receptor protein involved in Fe transport